MSVGFAEMLAHQISRRIRKESSLVGLLVMALLVPQSLLLSGCAGSVSANGKHSEVQAAFQLNPASVNFGQVTVGKQATQLVSMSNTGNMALNITQVKLSNAQFSVLNISTPIPLPVGKTGTFQVAVNPTSAGSLTGTLTAEGDGGSTPVIVNLSATAVSLQPQLSLSSANINFGSVSSGLKATSNLVLTNSGATNLTISLLTLTGADFAISGISTPATVPAGQSVAAVVTFSPTAAGSTTGSLVITSNDPTNPTLAVPLSGTGTTVATGQLSASPALLSFGNVATGSSTEKQIVVTNAGNAAVKISSATAVGAGLTISGVAPPTTVNPSASVTLTASFAPNATGSDTGSITIVSDAGNSPLTIPTSGSGVQAGLTISPASYNFGSVVDGQTKSQTITLTNTGTAALTIAELSVNGTAYSVSGLVTPATIAAGSNATFTVLFEPTTAGSLTGTVSITSNAPNSPNVLSLSGTGTAATVTLSSNPSSMSFLNVNAGSSSSQSATITNSGNTSVSVSQVTVNAKDFKVSGITAPFTLTAGQSAAMSVSFSPSTSESITGNIEVSSSQGATAVISVSGNGLQPGLTIVPSSASFGDVTVGSPATQAIQLSNSGTGTLSVTQVSAAGSGFSTGTLSLPITLGSGQSTSINAQFAPASAGTASGSLTIVSNAPNSPAVVAMSGTGVASTQVLTFSSTNLGFGNVNTGSSSTQSVTVTNSGNTSVSISQITESGAGFTLSGAGTPVTLTAGQSMTFGVIFSPSAAGSATGSVTVSSTASGSPKTIALAGTGVEATVHSATLTWTASTSTVSGYNVYRSATSGSGYAKINPSLVASVTYDDTTVQSGTTYYYVVTAVNASGEESTDSNQATAVIP